MTEILYNYRDRIILSRQLRISITSACNMNCVYCHNEGKQKSTNMLSYEDFIHILEISAVRGFKEVRITGGEPCIHPDLVKMCTYIRKYYPSLTIGINTNGVSSIIINQLIKEKLIDRIVVGIDYFDGKISKNSTLGLSSVEIKKNILNYKILFQTDNPDTVGVDMVYMGDDQNTVDMIDWCLESKLYLKILEVVDIHCKPSLEKNEYDIFVDSVFDKYKYSRLLDSNGFAYFLDDNGVRVRFIESYCRKKSCIDCMSNNIRVTSEGEIIRCLKQNKKAYNIMLENCQEVYQSALYPNVEEMI